MPGRWRAIRTGQSSELWPVLLLMIVVILPTIGVLWFVGVALNNERLANRQRLADAYRTQLVHVQQQLEDHWQAVTQSADAGDSRTGLARFLKIVSDNKADAVICFELDGEIAYPNLPNASVTSVPGKAWKEAVELEFDQQEVAQALEQYRNLRKTEDEPSTQAAAVQAEVRCLYKLNQAADAIALVWSAFDGPLGEVRDSNGRVIAANVELMIFDLAGDDPHTQPIRERLHRRLHETGPESLPASQRLFLLKRLAELDPTSVDLHLRDAEDLALRFIAAHPQPVRSSVFQTSQLPGLWQIATADGQNLLLWRTETLLAEAQNVLREESLSAHMQVTLLPPRELPTADEWTSLRAGPRLPGWRLSLTSTAPIEDASASQQTISLWMGALTVLLIAAIAVALAFSFHRRIRVANLKNDLVGTVSHELKTPLSSIRLLVDTLLDAPQLETVQTREYLQLIANENQRLSRLIENFLTFSRLEQGRQPFEFHPIQPTALVARTTEAVGERYREPGCDFHVEQSPGLPEILGDEESLVTAILNLLDNAYKYSREPREIGLSVFQENLFLCFAVRDNGIGLTRSAVRNVFQKFYQVDRSLVREGQGCGLGLSIVKDIVKAHHGETTVISTPGSGSTFTIQLPISAEGAS